MFVCVCVCLCVWVGEEKGVGVILACYFGCRLLTDRLARLTNVSVFCFQMAPVRLLFVYVRPPITYK